MTITIYGIPNCDTIKKTKRLFDDSGTLYAFHDYRKQGVPVAVIEQAIATAGWENVVNRRGTTWRQLSDDQKEAVNDDASALAILTQHPSMIKRPIVTHQNTLIVGFSEPALKELIHA